MDQRDQLAERFEAIPTANPTRRDRRPADRGTPGIDPHAHARGVRVVGATLPPFKGNAFHNESTEAIRDAFNRWIRTSGEYDAIFDLDRALADPTDPDALRPDYASFDYLHPNDAGMAAIARAIEPVLRPVQVAGR